MKYFIVVLVLVLSVSLGVAQDYINAFNAPFCKTAYGAASFKADSNYVWVNGTNKWFTVTISYDTTAGSTVAYWCRSDDSTKAIPLRPGTGGSYGDARTFKVYGLRWYRVKGAVPVTTVIE